MSRARIVRWMLEEVGEPYETKIIEFGHSMKGPEYLAINPMGKVPAIRHGETVVTEAAAICAYLADAFPAAGLAPPPGSRERGPYYRWLFFAAGPVEAAVTDKALGFEIPVEREGMVGYGNIERALAALEGALYRVRVYRGRPFHRRGRLCRLADRLGHDVPGDRQAAGLRALLGALERAARPLIRAPRRSTTSSIEERKKAAERPAREGAEHATEGQDGAGHRRRAGVRLRHRRDLRPRGRARRLPRSEGRGRRGGRQAVRRRGDRAPRRRVEAATTSSARPAPRSRPSAGSTSSSTTPARPIATSR